MMSQSRLGVKDRLRADHDYRVNLKAELEIWHLHEQLDRLLSHQWERLIEVQQVQIELLEELAARTLFERARRRARGTRGRSPGGPEGPPGLRAAAWGGGMGGAAAA